MKRSEKYKNTDVFTFHNANPKGKFTDDCVIRALSAALNIPYYDVLKALYETCVRTGYMVNSKPCFTALLKKLGYDKQKQPKHADGSKYTGFEFCRAFKTGRYIAMIGGHHIVAIVDGKIQDIWDCSEKCIGNFWKVG